MREIGRLKIMRPVWMFRFPAEIDVLWTQNEQIPQEKIEENEFSKHDNVSAIHYPESSGIKWG